MTEKPIGKAKFHMRRNDLYWDFEKLEFGDEGDGSRLELHWTGYNDDAWWTKWSKGCDIIERDGRKFRIDFGTCDVYEMFEGADHDAQHR